MTASNEYGSRDGPATPPLSGPSTASASPRGGSAHVSASPAQQPSTASASPRDNRTPISCGSAVASASSARSRLRSLTPPRGIEASSTSAQARLRSLTPPRGLDEALVAQIAGQLSTATWQRRHSWPSPAAAASDCSPLLPLRQGCCASAREPESPAATNPATPTPGSPFALGAALRAPQQQGNSLWLTSPPLGAAFRGRHIAQGSNFGAASSGPSSLPSPNASPSAGSSMSPCSPASPSSPGRRPRCESSPQTSPEISCRKQVGRAAFDGLFMGFKDAANPRQGLCSPERTSHASLDEQLLCQATQQPHDRTISNFPSPFGPALSEAFLARGHFFELSNRGLDNEPEDEDESCEVTRGAVPSKPCLPKRMPRKWRLPPSSVSLSQMSSQMSDATSFSSRSLPGTPAAVSSESLSSLKGPRIYEQWNQNGSVEWGASPFFYGSPQLGSNSPPLRQRSASGVEDLSLSPAPELPIRSLGHSCGRKQPGPFADDMQEAPGSLTCLFRYGRGRVASRTELDLCEAIHEESASSSIIMDAGDEPHEESASSSAAPEGTIIPPDLQGPLADKLGTLAPADDPRTSIMDDLFPWRPRVSLSKWWYSKEPES